MTAAAAANVLDRAQIGGTSSETTRFSPALSLALASPAAYDQRCCNGVHDGVWLGPAWVATGNPARTGPSSIEWSVSFASSMSPEASARAILWQGWSQTAGGPVQVPHVVSGRRVGTVPGFALLTAEPAPGARHQGALALSLGRGVLARVLFDVSAPFSDSAGAHGAFVVAGTSPSTWNRARSLEALEGVYLEASLPPSRIRVRVTTRRLRGSVQDVFGHPVAESRVRLERKRGRAWRTVHTTMTSGTGTYSLRAPSRGRYRVVAKLAGVTVRGAAVTVRR